MTPKQQIEKVRNQAFIIKSWFIDAKIHTKDVKSWMASGINLCDELMKEIDILTQSLDGAGDAEFIAQQEEMIDLIGGDVLAGLMDGSMKAVPTLTTPAKPTDERVMDAEAREAVKWASAIVKDGELVECDYVHLGKEPIYVPYLKALIRAATAPKNTNDEGVLRRPQ